MIFRSLDADLSHTAKLLYTLLLDRATLSQKNNWVDERGFVYVIFPISSLSEALRCSTMSIKRALRSLEDADLIERRRGRIPVPNSIFVKVPTEQKCSFAWNGFALCDGTEMIPSMEQKCSTNQRNKSNLKDNHLIRTTDAHLTFGEYRNVYLTEKEYKRLKTDFASRLPLAVGFHQETAKVGNLLIYLLCLILPPLLHPGIERDRKSVV